MEDASSCGVCAGHTPLWIFGPEGLMGCEELINTALSLRTTPSLSICAMRLLWFFSAVVALHCAVGASTGKERRSTPNEDSPTVLTPEFVEIVQEIVEAGDVPGLTLAFVSLTGPPELGAWGIKSENGTNMTTDVR